MPGQGLQSGVVIPKPQELTTQTTGSLFYDPNDQFLPKKVTLAERLQLVLAAKYAVVLLLLGGLIYIGLNLGQDKQPDVLEPQSSVSISDSINQSALVNSQLGITVPAVFQKSLEVQGEIVLGGQLQLSGLDCSGFDNGGVLTTDEDGNITCDDDDAPVVPTAPAAPMRPHHLKITADLNRLSLITGDRSVGNSWLLQNGSTLQLDDNRSLSLLGGNLNIAGNQTTSGSANFGGLLTVSGGLTLQTGDTFTMNGNAFTDLTGVGLQTSSGTLTLDSTDEQRLRGRR